MRGLLSCFLACSAGLVFALQYDPAQVEFNLNTNQQAQTAVDYTGEWENHDFNPSPKNWRFPIYSLFLDRFVNGDPSNDDANGTVFEHDVSSTQLRHGGDLVGLTDTLDYIQGMGVKASAGFGNDGMQPADQHKGIYIAGTPFINQPWKSDGYSPLDFTLLDRHFGNIDDWRAAINEIHSRGMYVILDNTLSTMGDLIAFTGFENASTPFDPKEHTALWKTDRRYPDFTFDNTYNPTCQYPRFWNESGGLVLPQLDSNFSELVGCYESEFDQYGDTEAFGVFPDWQRQLSKFASVQDRLREWNPSVLAKLQQMSCVTIGMLDIDGFRFDKATQVTVDAQANFTQFLRQCAKKYGKDNFFLPGEVTGGNTFGSIYFGRGREPQMVPENNTVAVTLTSDSNSSLFLREPGKNALDAAAFHYSIYRSLTRFLGMDGNLTAGYDVPVNFVDTWNTILSTNDLVNANTGEFDPRHMYGTSNQDVFRWPGIENGVDKMLMALYVTTLYMPGIPLLLWGEEQAFYVLDSTADNYLFGRQAMSAAHAWQDHGCYKLGSSQYYDFPVDALNTGCLDDSVSLDHRDPTHPVRNIIKSMYHLREQYPVLNDGYLLDSLSNQTHYIYLPGSNGTPTETGMWSVLRDQWFAKVQDLGGEAKGGNQSVWLVYSNNNQTVNYAFDCHDDDGRALIAPFAAGTTVKNLLSPYDTLKLVNSTKKLGIDNSRDFNGCFEQLQMGPWDYRAYVPEGQWIAPPPMMTKFVPGHDARILSTVQPGQQEKVDIEFQFSQEMDCDSISLNLVVNSTTSDAITAQLDNSTVTCSPIPAGSPTYIGQVMSTWSWKGTLIDVSNGVHTVTVSNATTPNDTSTGSVDRVMFRIGQADNVMVFPRTANYSTEVLLKDPSTGDLSVNQKAAGADMWRYSLNFGSSWSNWTAYDGTNSTLAPQPWSGTNQQKWKGDHVMLQYWSRMTGSSDYVQHGDVASQKTPPRRFPHLFAEGPFNQFGFDGGLDNSFDQDSDGTWKFHLMTEWPSHFQVNVWGMNPDGQPDQTFVYGDVDNDTVLDRLPPDALAPAVVNMSQLPPSPYLAYEMRLTDGVNKFQRVPVGSRLIQILVFALLWALPVLTGAVSIWAYMGAFYGVKFNKIGLGKAKIPTFGLFRRKARFQKLAGDDYAEDHKLRPLFLNKSRNTSAVSLAPPTSVTSTKRRKVIIATMEYDIEDWSIKIKIGGLGVMAQLMGKSLEHQDLIWVVPCVGGVDYPIDQPAEPMTVTILGSPYEILVQYHQLKNITYVLLDAPVFRQQTKNEPYPPRMDDLDSAIYYSAWNACIAETVRRFQPDIYHINDYHGAAAPLYLLPETIPACLSLHNAEFQGLWPMRNLQESSEVCRVYNLDPDIVQKYVQFGEVFNLLHAGTSYLRVHQKGFGAVGVSNKYGARSFARYPIFWGLKEIGKLPNPDPSDTAPWSREEEENQVITVDPKYEASRADLRKQAQEWAGLNVDPKAELFTFVGRWSNQKGVDLIADVFPSILEKHPKVQLICVGPVIDLYGKFAALKLGEMMKKYPKRVFSKPEFTALPPYIFSGSEFALIPSRDEPFGLVAVEFGRKGALGVGARVGGLGQMPGWWFTVESTTTSHMIHQFKSAIEDALNSKTEVRAMMRARSAKQRFPVAKWVEDLDILQSTAIKIHHEQNSGNRRSSKAMSLMPTRESEMVGARSRNNSPDRHSIYESAPEQTLQPQQATGLSRNLSLGSRRGPGHRPSRFTINIEPSTPIGPRIEEEDEDDASLYSNHDEYTISREEADAATMAERERSLQALEGGRGDSLLAHPLPTAERGRGASRRGGNDSGPSRSPSPAAGERLLAADEERGRSRSPARQSLFVDTGDDRGRSRSPAARDSLLVVDDPRRRSTSQFSVASRASMSSMLDLSEVKGDKTDFNLQKVELSFNDTTGEYYNKFEQMLQNLNGKTSEKDLCIEEYLVESEKAWFKKYRDAKLGRSRDPSPAAGAHVTKRQSRASVYSNPEENDSEDAVSVGEGDRMEDFLLGENYHRPSVIKRWMQTRIGDWPIYSLFLALGQIIAANSYQITLLTGGEEAGPELLYIIGGIYIVTSGVWWVMFRTLKARWVLSVPFIFYGLAFAFVGFAPFLPKGAGRSWMRNVADGMYTAASSSGSLFFTLNFGDEGGSPIKTWVFRACIIQGTQNIYTTALFYWGRTITQATATSKAEVDILSSSKVFSAVTLPLAGLCWLISLLLFTSLPAYYQQQPGKIPSFYHSLLRRKLIFWFFAAVLLQNYFLSAPYGRNWNYLWSSNYAPQWTIALLVLVFFLFAWIALLFIFSKLSRAHSWILPIFAIGLGAPRWAQMLWGTSGFGLWVPWMPGGPVAGALAGRTLWLWLGVLDAVQGVGFGMMLLQTLTRIHIGVTLVSSQILGAAVTMVAKATAPDRDGPGDVFPDFSRGVVQGISKPWFWIALGAQVVIPVGFFMFFRKEQLSKP